MIPCLACSPKFSTVDDALKHSRYSTLTASTRDQAVAMCAVSQFVPSAVVYAKSIRDQEWSVVKTLKGFGLRFP